MAIELKEILGFSIEDVGKYNQSLPPPKNKELDESYKEINPNNQHRNVNRVIIEAIHCYPFATRNFTRYMPEACKKSTHSWLDPYNRPVIMYHNDYNGEITGRVVDADVKISEKTGGDCLFLTATAPDWYTWDKITSGIYKTTSIGVAATDVRCSICGAKLTEKMCEHEKGFSYDGEICYWDVYEFDPKEISYVITPSDPYSQIISIGYEEREETKTEDGISVVDSRHHQYMMTNKESKTQNDNKENNSDIMDITINESKYNELVQMKEALEVEKKVLTNDKQELSKTINDLNKEKLVAQESIKILNQTIADKDTEIDAFKQMKEALEEENKKLMERVKESIIDKIVSIRESANLPKIDKLEERSLDVLMINLSDLKADIAARETIDARESVKPEGLTDEKEKPTDNEKKLEENEKEATSKTVFDL